MTLVTRVSVAFLVALALALGGFSACLYYVAGLRLRLALDQELEATLDRFPDRPESASGRVTWAIYDESGRRVEGTPGGGRPMVLDGRDLGPLAVDLATTIKGPDGLRWRVLARPIGGGRRHRGPPDGRGGDHRPGPQGRDEREGGPQGRDRAYRVLAAWASLEPVESEIRSLAAVLPLIALWLWALAAAVGRHFARRAVAPLLVMAESARTMPFDDCRLPSPGTRDELEDFACSFNGLLDRLHVALEQQRQFTGQASHQLRTPLAALIAAIDVARRRRRTVEEHERVLDGLHGDAVRLWRVVEALLFLARADADAGLPDLECLDVSAWASRPPSDLVGPRAGGRPAVREQRRRTALDPGASAAARPVAGQSARERLQVQRGGNAGRRAHVVRAERGCARRFRTADAASRTKTWRGCSSHSIAPSRPGGWAARGSGWAWLWRGESPFHTAARSAWRASQARAAGLWCDCRGRLGRRPPKRWWRGPRRSRWRRCDGSRRATRRHPLLPLVLRG